MSIRSRSRPMVHVGVNTDPLQMLRLEETKYTVGKKNNLMSVN